MATTTERERRLEELFAAGWTTGANGPFELVGMDRTRVRDGLVCENYVFFDLGQFQELVGR